MSKFIPADREITDTIHTLLTTTASAISTSYIARDNEGNLSTIFVFVSKCDLSYDETLVAFSEGIAKMIDAGIIKDEYQQTVLPHVLAVGPDM
jgi:hypothetical protein